TRFSRDWSSDVCSSDLAIAPAVDTLLHIAHYEVFMVPARSVAHGVDQQGSQVIPLPFRRILEFIEEEMPEAVPRFLPDECGVAGFVGTDTAQEDLCIADELCAIIAPPFGQQRAHFLEQAEVI